MHSLTSFHIGRHNISFLFFSVTYLRFCEFCQVEPCNIHDTLETAKLFTFLQILTAIFGAFAHGGNDVRYVQILTKQSVYVYIPDGLSKNIDYIYHNVYYNGF